MRTIFKLLTISAAAASLGACAYGDVGMGYGSPYGYNGYGYGSPYGYGSSYGYSPYGYGNGVSVSIGSGYGYAPYGYGGYGYSPYGYGNGYGSPYYGWYGDYYYPGTGVYVYDSYRRPHQMSDSQRRYWTDRKNHYRARAGAQSVTTPARQNWSGFQRERSHAISDRVQSRIDSAHQRVTQSQASTPDQGKSRAERRRERRND
jgi:hypothetical protein